jgi:hypothetical protein
MKIINVLGNFINLKLIKAKKDSIFCKLNLVYKGDCCRLVNG